MQLCSLRVAGGGGLVVKVQESRAAAVSLAMSPARDAFQAMRPHPPTRELLFGISNMASCRVGTHERHDHYLLEHLELCILVCCADRSQCLAAQCTRVVPSPKLLGNP